MWCSPVGCLVTLALSPLIAPLAAVVQPAGKVHKIGFLHMSSATAVARNFEAFQQGLHELGSIAGQNLVIGMERGEGSTIRSHKTHIGTLA
jgi:hypothetical protein